MTSKVIVFIYLEGEVTAVPAGTLYLDQLGHEVTSRFVYGRRYMDRKNAIELDPLSLPFISVTRKADEEITPNNGLNLFGAFRDATPDSWGRRVIEKQLKRIDLPEIDYIRHSFDDRVGALDFRDSATDGPRKHPFNRVLELDYLLECADKIDNDEPVPEDVLQVFHYGSSMGGARPKAVVEDADGLWLAKFRSRNDKFDYATVEAATLLLAQECGIDVPTVRVVPAAGSNVFLIKRFDRHKVDSGYARTHFVSALTLLGKDEGESLGSGYSDILSALVKYCNKTKVEAMKVELFRRMVFNVLVTNTDDHLRNHGFIFEKGCYCLSKAYDIVPTVSYTGSDRHQHLNVGTYGRLSTIENVLTQCGLFGLGQDEAKSIVLRMMKIVSNWREFYGNLGVAQKDLVVLERAFRSFEI
jgi:serine/threonine-protein kinase HipA